LLPTPQSQKNIPHASQVCISLLHLRGDGLGDCLGLTYPIGMTYLYLVLFYRIFLVVYVYLFLHGYFIITAFDTGTDKTDLFTPEMSQYWGEIYVRRITIIIPSLIQQRS